MGVCYYSEDMERQVRELLAKYPTLGRAWALLHDEEAADIQDKFKLILETGVANAVADELRAAVLDL
jgi:hypothetical protein